MMAKRIPATEQCDLETFSPGEREKEPVLASPGV